MDIFITWSGPRSLAVAQALKEYLPLIVNDFCPWLSEADINKGASWGTELSAALSRARAGIVCLTPSNFTAPWLLFEAGAIAKQVTEKPLACTLLIGLKSSDLSGPLSLFQDTKLAHDDLLKLVRTLNGALGEKAVKEAQVEKAFDLVWPKLKEKLDSLPSDGPSERPHRTERELLEEVVDLVRSKGASDAVALSRVEVEMKLLNHRLALAEDSLLLERDRLTGLQRDLSWNSDPTAGVWRVAGGEVVAGGRDIRAGSSARADPNAAAERQASALLKEARRAKAKNFMKKARKEGPAR